MAENAVAPTTRAEILSTALQLFTVQGYDATSLRQIADRLGFTKAALYYHFPAKEHLVIELTRPWLDAISDLVTMGQQTDADGSTDEARARLVRGYVDTTVDQHAVLRFLSQDLAAMKHPDVGKRARSLVLALNDALAGPEADDAARIRVACAISAVHSISLLDESMLDMARPIAVSIALSILGIEDQEPT